MDVLQAPGPIVISGDDGLAVRAIEELSEFGETVVAIVPDAGSPVARTAKQHGGEAIVGDYCQEHCLRNAGVPAARALALLRDDDLGNLQAAMRAQDIAPELRLVVRCFNVELGHRLEQLFANATLLSASGLAAPAFTHAALFGSEGHSISIQGRHLRATELAEDDPRLLMSLDRFDVPAQAEDRHRRGVVLALAAAEGKGASAREHRRRPWLRPHLSAMRVLVTRRLIALLVLLVATIALSSVVYHNSIHLSWLDSVYYTVSTLATIGFAGVDPLEASTLIKVYDIVLIFVGAALLALFFAVITDTIVGARLAEALGRVRRPKCDHVVVCGLGTVGLPVVEELHRLNVPCIAVERLEDSPFVQSAHQLGVPVVTADASRRETLEEVGIERARCLVAVTDDDLVNLEAGLVARELRPKLRVVLRLFDAHLARRAESGFGIDITRSLSSLAAPWFVTAIVGRRLEGTLPVGRDALCAVELPVEDGAAPTLGELTASGEAGVLAVDGEWNPPSTLRPRAGQRLLVLSTVRGIAEMSRRLRAVVHTGA